MSGFSSYDDFINEATVNGKIYRQDWNKLFLPTTTGVAGEWNFLARGAGNPGADALFNTGTNLDFQPITNATANAASIQHGPNVYPDYKYITNSNAYSVIATCVPSFLQLVDLVGFVRVTFAAGTTPRTINTPYVAFSTFTADAGTDILTSTGSAGFCNLLEYTRVQLTTTTTLPAGLATATDYFVIKLSDTTIQLASSYANAVAGTPIDISDAGTGTHTLQTHLPRYTNGAGLQSFMWANNATPLGAATPNLSIAYTNSAQTAGRATPAVLPIGKTAAPNGLVLYSGTGAGKYGPYLPMASGDSGISRLETVTVGTSYVSGEFSIGLCRPLITLNLTTAGVACEREYFSQVAGGMRRIYDGAALYWLAYLGANTVVASPWFGDMTFAWG